MIQIDLWGVNDGVESKIMPDSPAYFLKIICNLKTDFDYDTATFDDALEYVRLNRELCLNNITRLFENLK